MKKSGRYDTSSLIEDQFEPGSQGRVLRNLLGLKTKRAMGAAESDEFLRTTNWAIRTYERNHIFTAGDICLLHHIWLEDIYRWAGQYRQVIMSKDDFTFAFPVQIPKLMLRLEENYLRRYTPCSAMSIDQLVEALAVVHSELLLIHPFREGNGRIARLLAILMTLQAGLPLLDFSMITGKKKLEYFRAVQSGLDRNYEPMMQIFRDLISLISEIAEQEQPS